MFFKRTAPNKGVSLAGEIQELRHLTSANGSVVPTLVGLVDLPDVEFYKLKNLIKEKVPLKQVNTKILNGGFYEDLGDIVESSDKSSVEPKKEVNE